MPISPCPGPPSAVGRTSAGELSTRTPRPDGPTRTVTRTAAPAAWRAALARRLLHDAVRGQPDRRGHPVVVHRLGVQGDRQPGPRVPRPPSRPGRSRSGCGAVCGPVVSLRSTPSSRRMSVSASRADAAMATNSAAAGAGTSVSRYGAVSACTAISDMWWATTSCISRAIRVRSSSTARRSCSRSLSSACAASACRDSRLRRIRSPTIASAPTSSRTGTRLSGWTRVSTGTVLIATTQTSTGRSTRATTTASTAIDPSASGGVHGQAWSSGALNVQISRASTVSRQASSGRRGSASSGATVIAANSNAIGGGRPQSLSTVNVIRKRPSAASRPTGAA